MKLISEKLQIILMFIPIWLNKRIADMEATNNNRHYKVFVINWRILILSVKEIDDRKMRNRRIEKKLGRKFIRGANLIELDEYLVYTAKPKNIIV